MRYRRADVVQRALALLDSVGLPELTMRRLGAELGVQPSALYHHVPNKQTLLGLMADELLSAVEWPDAGQWPDQVALSCHALHQALLEVRDGAELVATVWSFGLGAAAPFDHLVRILDQGEVGALAPSAARTLLHYVYGHAVNAQTHRQAAEFGAIAGAQPSADDLDTGLAVIVAGIQVVRAAPARA